MNDQDELNRKQDWLLHTLVEDNRRRRNDMSLELDDFLPTEEVECFAGYERVRNARKEKFEAVVLPDTINDDGKCGRHINDYIQNVYHSVEILPRSPTIKYDPHAADKTNDVQNIEYILSNDESNNRQFRINLMSDLGLHGVPVTASQSVEVLRAALLERLRLQYRIQRYKDALKCHQRALANNRVICPSKAPPCILHFHQRTMEKIVSEILSRGIDCCSSRQAIQDFATDVNQVVNRDVFGRIHLHTDDQSGWSVPLTPDGKELGEISMDGSTAKMFMNKIDYLIDVCFSNDTTVVKHLMVTPRCFVT